MVRFKTFRKALKHVKKINITDIQADNSFTVEKAVYDFRKKEYAFLNADGIDGVDFVIRQRDISLISRENTDDPDNEYVFLINTRDGKQYGMTFFMKDGYSFFAATDYERENIEAIIKATPKYLCNLKGKSVVVRKSINHEAFSTWNPNDDNEDLLITEKFVISDFDYGVRKKSGLAIVDFFDKSTYNKATAVDVTFIVSDADNEDSVIVGTTMGEFSLTPTN